MEGCSPDAMTSPESAIVYLRNIEDENSSIFKSVSEKINLRISKNPKSKDAVSKICLDEFGADIGTPLYKRFLAGLLSRTSLKENSEILLGEIKRSLPDVKNRKYVESLIRIIGESKDKDAAANLERLLDCDAPEYALVCSLRAVSKIKTPNAAEIAKARAKKLLSENATPKELKEQAVKSLIEVGEEVDLSLVTKDSIGFLGNHRHIQIPKYISFKTLPDELQAPLINALTLRGEAYEDIIRLTAKDSKFALAITSAIVKFGKLDDLRTAFNFAELYSEREADEASSLISSIKGENRLKCIWGIKASLSGRPKELLLKTLSKAPISDGEAEFLLNIISGDNSSEDKLLALSLLQNAGEKCEKIADLAKTRFESSSNPDEKMRCLQLLALNQTDDNARLCILAYRQGFKDLAAQELCKWKTPEILGQIFDLYKTQDAESTKVLENTIYCVLKNSKAFDGEICDFLIENAEDKAIAEKIIKLRRGDLKGFKMIDMPFGIKAAALSDSVKNAFDGDPETRFEAEGELSCFFLEFPNTRMLKALDVNSESKPDSWKIFAGEDLCDMAEIEYAASELSKNKYRLAFKNPHKAKFVKLENIKGSNISEMDFINDSSVYIKDLDRVGKRCIASARDHPGWAKLAFDDMISTSWTGAPNREPGQWFFFGLDKIKDVSGVELLLGKHKDARVIAPKVYAGKYADDMRLVEIDYAELASSDFIKFRSPQNVRFILIENNGLKEGSWRISEIKVQ
ncbi:MAG: hypothetical protein J6P03_06615 [Opitutales bacterium]|nr:hypothetical protein [Opitutales bacterium]